MSFTLVYFGYFLSVCDIKLKNLLSCTFNSLFDVIT